MVPMEPRFLQLNLANMVSVWLIIALPVALYLLVAKLRKGSTAPATGS